MADINLTGIDNLKALDIVEKLHVAGSDQLKNEGSIRIGSKTYKVSYVQGDDGAAKLQMKRHYTGFLIGPFLNLWNKKSLASQTHAQELTRKVGELMKTGEYQLVRNTYDKLMDIAKAAGAKRGVIEVGNYGHSEPRDKIANLGVVAAVNRSLKKSGKSIHLNKIDTYNTILGIKTGTLMPDKYGKLMKKIAGGTLQPDEDHLYADYHTVDGDDVKQWRAFIARPENAAKIDIPRKLHAYLNQGAGPGGDDNLVGWKKDFRLNPDAALRHFVVKNMPASSISAGLATEEMIGKMCGKIKEYVEIYNMEDGPAKDERLKDFFDLAKWDKSDDDNRLINEKLESRYRATAKDKNMPVVEVKRRFGKQIRADFQKAPAYKALECVSSYRLFANIIMYATFRQTSKLGLDFFKEQGKPVLFHMSHRDLTDFGNPRWILEENHWKSGQLDPKYAGSEITHSEVRHADKIVARYGDAADLWYVQGVN
jgi:hypothetical protein